MKKSVSPLLSLYLSSVIHFLYEVFIFRSVDSGSVFVRLLIDFFQHKELHSVPTCRCRPSRSGPSPAPGAHFTRSRFSLGDSLVCVSQRVPWFCSPARVSLTRRARHSISSVLVCSRRSSRWLARPHFRVLGLEQISFFRFGSCFLCHFLARPDIRISQGARLPNHCRSCAQLRASYADFLCADSLASPNQFCLRGFRLSRWVRSGLFLSVFGVCLSFPFPAISSALVFWSVRLAFVCKDSSFRSTFSFSQSRLHQEHAAALSSSQHSHHFELFFGLCHLDFCSCRLAYRVGGSQSCFLSHRIKGSSFFCILIAFLW
jgi:hypothetical protein